MGGLGRTELCLHLVRRFSLLTKQILLRRKPIKEPPDHSEAPCPPRRNCCRRPGLCVHGRPPLQTTVSSCLLPLQRRRMVAFCANITWATGVAKKLIDSRLLSNCNADGAVLGKETLRNLPAHEFCTSV
jgi:hypothetical protein